ncbi:MAG: hypothetical protein QME59_07480, partial [Candidatus Hydrothermarchaeota archaeon]|nr:hypothetical protein [Candidatus Hydrothermarchaeota archaeon]
DDRGTLSDNRDRATSDLQRIYGVLTELKAEMLYQQGKISSKEYEKILDRLNTPAAEEEKQAPKMWGVV